jgi:hypothetical protein
MSLLVTYGLGVEGLYSQYYCSLQDIRDEGITESELSDERAYKLMTGWQTWIDKMTGQFFISKELTLDFDGDGSRMLLLPVPIIDCYNLYVNDDFNNVVSTSSYTVYNRRGPVQDDRSNPHILLKRSIDNIYASISGGVFKIGDRNQRVHGTWGYVELDGSVPAPICRAMLILVIASMELLPDDQIDQLRVGRIVEEVTDRHRIQYSDLYDRLKTWAPTGITDVDTALKMYRSPMRIGAPRTMSLRV